MLLTAGCTEHLPPPATDIDALVAMRSTPMVAMNVGSFEAEGTAASHDNGVSVRLGTFKPPKGTTWSSYLGETVSAQLSAAGRLDPNAPTSISGTLIENRSGENMADGRAILSARFKVSRNGAVVYDKVQTVTAAWDSTYWGFIAYESALRNYTALYPQLVRQLIADPAFKHAVAP